MCGHSIDLDGRVSEPVRSRWFWLVRAMAASLALAVLAGDADAAVRTWTGAASALWSNAGNWGGTAPVAGDDLVFPAGALNTTNVNDLPANTLFTSISFPCWGSYTVTGNAVVLGSGGLTTAGGVTLGVPITLGVDQTWTTIPGDAWPDVSGAIHLGGRTLTLDLLYSLILSGPIDGAGALVKGGGFALTLSGANSYSGPTTVETAFSSSAARRDWEWETARQPMAPTSWMPGRTVAVPRCCCRVSPSATRP